MTDRHSGYIVTLEQDIREDDAKQTIEAIACIKNVVSVEPIIGNLNLHLAYARARNDLQKRLWKVLNPVLEETPK